MDLISAQVEAAKKSKASGKKVYIVVDDEGECELSNAPLKGAISCYSNGSEVPIENQETAVQAKTEKAVAEKSTAKKSSTNKNTTNMETSKKSAKKVAKKSAKKVAAKKAAPTQKKEVVAKKGEKILTVKEILALVSKGNPVTWDGKRLTKGYLEKMKNKDRKVNVIVLKVD